MSTSPMFNINFHPVADVALYSGVDLGGDNYLKRKIEEVGLKVNEPNMRIARFQMMEHTKEISQWDYPKFRDQIKANIVDLKKLDPSELNIVAHKLDNLAQEQLNKEKNYNFVRKIFIAIGHFFGYKTSGEKGKLLAEELTGAKVKSADFKSLVAAYKNKNVYEWDVESLNNLSAKQFYKFLDETVFTTDTSWNNLLPNLLDKPQYLYGALTNEQLKDVFKEKLATDKNGANVLQQIFGRPTTQESVLAYAGEVSNTRIPELKKVLTPNLAIKVFNDTEFLQKGDMDIEFKKAIFETVIKDLVERGDYPSVAKVLKTDFKDKEVLYHDSLDVEMKEDLAQNLSPAVIPSIPVGDAKYF